MTRTELFVRRPFTSTICWGALLPLLLACSGEAEDAPFLPCGTERMAVGEAPVFLGITPWPGGVIPYSYDSAVGGPENVSGTTQFAIRDKMNSWTSATHGRIVFVHDPGNAERAIIYPPPPGPCSSGLGWDQTPGVQWSAFGNAGCPLAHEIGHLIGFAHEQARLDKDHYVRVTEPPILAGNDDSANLGPFDYDSTMLYEGIEKTDGTFVGPHGIVPTAQDAADVVEMYANEVGSWKRATTMGKDVGALVPLSYEIVPGVTIKTGSSPAVARSSTSMFVFVRGSNDIVYYNSSTALGKPAWFLWTAIGSSTTVNSDPSATWHNGQVIVAARRSDGNVYYATQNSGFVWTSAGKPSSVSVSSAPVIVSSGSNQWDLLIRGSDNALWHRRRVGGSWAASWQSRGGNLRGTPAAVSRFADNLEVFSNSPSLNLMQVTASGSSWGTWAALPNQPCCLDADSGPAVATINSGRLDVVVRSTDDRFWWKRWDQLTGWTAYSPIGASATSNPTAAASGTSRIDTFFVKDGFGLWYKQRPPFRAKGDFDGDGRGDYACFRPSTTSWIVKLRSGGSNLTFPSGSGYTAAVPEDFDNDGKTDPVVFRPTTGEWRITRSAAGGNQTVVWGRFADYRLGGDYTGDGRADYVAFTANGGLWNVRGSSPWPATGFFAPPGPDPIVWGQTADIPVPGDYDGDAITDIAVWRPSEGRWYLRRSALGPFDVQWGVSTDKPVPGDYDGDGKTDVTVFRASDNTWRTFTSSSGATVITAFGTSTDRLVPKDYDGDGKTDLAYFRPSTGVWTFRPSSGGSDVSVTHCTSSDVVF
jgi:hypothetical protein